MPCKESTMTAQHAPQRKEKRKEKVAKTSTHAHKEERKKELK